MTTDTMKKVLIVDDEDAIRRLIRINLADAYQVIDTGNPDQALSLALQEKPNGILLDLRMPKYSGFELCRTFSSLAATQLIPLIIVSGEAGSTTKTLCKELGAADYFEKPVDFDALRARLSQLLETSRPERRSELRVRLRVMVKLQGADANGKPFEEVTPTENISKNGFLCGCTVPLKKDTGVEVSFVAGGTRLVGTARVVRVEGADTPYARYAFRFVEKQGEWILQ